MLNHNGVFRRNDRMENRVPVAHKRNAGPTPRQASEKGIFMAPGGTNIRSWRDQTHIIQQTFWPISI